MDNQLNLFLECYKKEFDTLGLSEGYVEEDEITSIEDIPSFLSDMFEGWCLAVKYLKENEN